ncbi:hypothetical protein Cadr_000019987 [Camelus dromedarius]|uniref:Uncharacterized protein n=1 Tax=Camelus dromedarius TaxID=9838 RepID=A0A5N4D6G1_CAMDR|nr:hypothetical protein Cadr_000019987 [Camelus dromedarius]
MVLELGTTQAVDPLRPRPGCWGLQVICMVGFYDAIYFRKMKPTRALRTPGQRWKLVLEPNGCGWEQRRGTRHLATTLRGGDPGPSGPEGLGGPASREPHPGELPCFQPFARAPELRD